MKELKNIYILIGASGSGKTKISEILTNEFHLKPLVSYTTRAPRFTKEDNHIFITVDEFHRITNKAAETFYAGNYYCATKSQVEHSDIYTLDVDGLKSFKKLYNGSKGYKIIYVDVSNELRIDRMVHRGDSLQEIKKRVEADNNMLCNVKMCADFIVNNNHSVMKSVYEIWNYIVYCETGIKLEWIN